MKIALSRMHFPVTTLGPGERVGLWFQGCSIRCPGCISMDTWAFNKNLVNISEVFELLESWLPTADGITITGGEPFDQFHQLKEILRFVQNFDHINSFVYSGYEQEELANQLKKLNGLIDIIMTGPLDISYSQSKPLRGSDNQRLSSLTSVGVALLNQINESPTNLSQLNVAFDGETTWIAGVPKRYDISRAIQIINADGIDARSMEGKKSTTSSHDIN